MWNATCLDYKLGYVFLISLIREFGNDFKCAFLVPIIYRMAEGISWTIAALWVVRNMNRLDKSDRAARYGNVITKVSPHAIVRTVILVIHCNLTSTLNERHTGRFSSSKRPSLIISLSSHWITVLCEYSVARVIYKTLTISRMRRLYLPNKDYCNYVEYIFLRRTVIDCIVCSTPNSSSGK